MKEDNNLDGFRKEINIASKKDPSTFFNWFNESGGNIETNFIKGQCEFTFYILIPLMKLMEDLKSKTALEIGYGGGRLLAAASYHFKKVIGVDIHNKFKIIEAELKKRNIHNFKLLQNNGRDIPVEDSSVDLVFSFIVLQHVGKIEIFNNYLKETYRTLRKGGYAILFFGRLYSCSSNTGSKLLMAVDRFLERIHYKGFKEIPAKINYSNLLISMNYSKTKSREYGLSIIGEGVSRKLPDISRYGGQHFLILKK
jgi:ubiquinone/menaquinone biosynthesis C-methylase UbiE